ncbi:MAG: WbqC family protein [Clostridiales bacterium]|nr:WbqC family protein [Clostridiales bacterium]
MRLAIMQPYFFPYLGYFQLIRAADKMIFYADLPFARHSWMDRNRLRHRNGDTFYFNAPVTDSRGRLIRDVGLHAREDWCRSFFKLLRCNYASAPHYAQIVTLLERHLPGCGTGEPGSLLRTNVDTLRGIANWLDVSTEIEALPNAYEAVEAGIAGLDKEERMTRRITDICRANGAKEYVNAIGGLALYDKDRFQREGVALSFVSTRPYRYSQQSADFIAGLSILDVLMHCGRDGTRALMAEYDLI